MQRITKTGNQYSETLDKVIKAQLDPQTGPNQQNVPQQNIPQEDVKTSIRNKIDKMLKWLDSYPSQGEDASKFDKAMNWLDSKPQTGNWLDSKPQTGVLTVFRNPFMPLGRGQSI